MLLVPCIETIEEIDASVNYSNFGESNPEDLWRLKVHSQALCPTDVLQK